MHIVFVSREYPPSFRGGGIASYLKIVAEGLVRIGHKVTVVAANDDTAIRDEKYVNGVRVIRLDGGDFIINEAETTHNKVKKLRFIYRYWSYRRKIVNEIRSLGAVDIVEVADFGGEGLYLHQLNIPIVYRLHTPNLLDHNNFGVVKLNWSNFPYYLFGKIELEILRRHAKYITSCSTSLKEWSIKHLGLQESSIRTLYNPLQPDFFNAAIIDAFEDDLVFFAGTICDWKGTLDLYEALKIVNSRRPKPLRLVMAGKTGAYGARLKELGKDDAWFKILGRLQQAELKAMYQKAAVVCFPSWWENMPMVCLEAMSVGAVVIGSNSGGMSEIIEDGESGFLLPPKSPEMWARKIEEIVGLSQIQRKIIAKKARDRIAAVFSLDKILTQMELYFNDVIANYQSNKNG